MRFSYHLLKTLEKCEISGIISVPKVRNAPESPQSPVRGNDHSAFAGRQGGVPVHRFYATFWAGVLQSGPTQKVGFCLCHPTPSDGPQSGQKTDVRKNVANLPGSHSARIAHPRLRPVRAAKCLIIRSFEYRTDVQDASLLHVHPVCGAPAGVVKTGPKNRGHRRATAENLLHVPTFTPFSEPSFEVNVCTPPPQSAANVGFSAGRRKSGAQTFNPADGA